MFMFDPREVLGWVWALSFSPNPTHLHSDMEGLMVSPSSLTYSLETTRCETQPSHTCHQPLLAVVYAAVVCQLCFKYQIA
jgi:hypothetical protein